MQFNIRAKLSVMMFLEFFIWGAWAVTMPTYLGTIGFSGAQVGFANSAGALAAIISPFFVGMIADRFFAGQHVMAVAHLLGAVLMFVASQVTEPILFFAALVGYTLCYMPTIALVNTIAFNQMEDPDKQFPGVRVFGTLGWIVAGVVISFVLVYFVDGAPDKTALPLQMAAACSLLLGIYSFFLPDTPPKSLGHKVTVRDVLGLDALALLKQPAFAIFIAASLFICIPLGFYYGFTNPFLNELGMSNVAATMTLGQVSEVFFMVVMPFFFVRLGVKYMLVAGMLAWVVRYVCFAFGDVSTMPLVSLLYVGILLHGICYDFFFVTGQIYVNRVAPKAVQASAQGFIALVTYGVGMFIGANIAGWVVDQFAYQVVIDGVPQLTEKGDPLLHHYWQQIWLIPAVMAFVVLALFAIFFREKPSAADVAEPAA